MSEAEIKEEQKAESVPYMIGGFRTQIIETLEPDAPEALKRTGPEGKLTVGDFINYLQFNNKEAYFDVYDISDEDWWKKLDAECRNMRVGSDNLKTMIIPVVVRSNEDIVKFMKNNNFIKTVSVTSNSFWNWFKKIFAFNK